MFGGRNSVSASLVPLQRLHCYIVIIVLAGRWSRRSTSINSRPVFAPNIMLRTWRFDLRLLVPSSASLPVPDLKGTGSYLDLLIFLDHLADATFVSAANVAAIRKLVQRARQVRRVDHSTRAAINSGPSVASFLQTEGEKVSVARVSDEMIQVTITDSMFNMPEVVSGGAPVVPFKYRGSSESGMSGRDAGECISSGGGGDNARAESSRAERGVAASEAAEVDVGADGGNPTMENPHIVENVDAVRATAATGKNNGEQDGERTSAASSSSQSSPDSTDHSDHESSSTSDIASRLAAHGVRSPILVEFEARTHGVMLDRRSARLFAIGVEFRGGHISHMFAQDLRDWVVHQAPDAGGPTVLLCDDAEFDYWTRPFDLPGSTEKLFKNYMVLSGFHRDLFDLNKGHGDTFVERPRRFRGFFEMLCVTPWDFWFGRKDADLINLAGRIICTSPRTLRAVQEHFRLQRSQQSGVGYLLDTATIEQYLPDTAVWARTSNNTSSGGTTKKMSAAGGVPPIWYIGPMSPQSGLIATFLETATGIDIQGAPYVPPTLSAAFREKISAELEPPLIAQVEELKAPEAREVSPLESLAWDPECFQWRSDLDALVRSRHLGNPRIIFEGDLIRLFNEFRLKFAHYFAWCLIRASLTMGVCAEMELERKGDVDSEAGARARKGGLLVQVSLRRISVIMIHDEC